MCFQLNGAFLERLEVGSRTRVKSECTKKRTLNSLALLLHITLPPHPLHSTPHR